MTDKDCIATLLTALDTALDIGLDVCRAFRNEGYSFLTDNIEILEQLQEYAAHERGKLDEGKEGES